MQTGNDAIKKLDAYIQNRTTSHWPYNVHVGGKRIDDKKINNIENLTERHKKYIGLKIEKTRKDWNCNVA